LVQYLDFPHLGLAKEGERGGGHGTDNDATSLEKIPLRIRRDQSAERRRNYPIRVFTTFHTIAHVFQALRFLMISIGTSRALAATAITPLNTEAGALTIRQIRIHPLNSLQSIDPAGVPWISSIEYTGG
jgi:hypothetical protein